MEMDFKISRWEMKRDQWKVSYTARGAVMKVQIARWAMERDQFQVS
jgi:hypothetical protein